MVKLSEPAEQEHFTYCAICEQLCGLKVTTRGDDILRIEPDKENPHNWQDFCIKAGTADEFRNHPARLRSPMKRVGDRYVAVSYEEAIEGIAESFKRIIDRDGPDAIGAYTGNPQSFNFSNTTFHGAFMDALGSHNRFWVGSIDQNAFHVVGEHMYGSEYTFLIPDIDACEYFLLIGKGWSSDKAHYFNGGVLDVMFQALSRDAAAAAYDSAGVGPEDIDVIELHDCLTTNELATYSALGLCEEADLNAFVADGDNTYGGRYVVNPSGGLLAKGHPLGATGLAQITELTLHLRGQAGQRQVEGARTALQHNGGLGSAGFVHIFQRS